jgi:peptidoglycan L-alanyl-D-glutamate endopeptidase CwlK
MRVSWPWLLGGLSVGLLLLRPAKAGDRPPATSLAVEDDLGLLQPRFRGKVRTLIDRMRVRGFDAYVFETWRSRARNKVLSDRGTGISPNADGSIPIGMHELGLAVDVISQSRQWGPGQAFWAALGQEAEALGLNWGGTWSTPDLPHVQAVPVNKQNEMRARFQKYGYDGVEA